MLTLHPRTRRPVADLAGAADRLGAAASLLCAVHCAALPFLLALLPALGLGFLASHGFERGFIAFASVFAVTMAVLGYRRRRRGARAFALLVPGLVLLWIGGFAFDLGGAALWHSIFVVAGGTCVALAHLANLRLARTEPSCDCVTPA
jgi:hypothetical protein